MLTDDRIWWRPHESDNSIGNLLLHLNGNVRQWIVVPFGGVPDARNRPAEFAEKRHIPGAELRERLDATLREVDEILQRMEPAALLQNYDIQHQKNVTGIEAIYHVVEHFAMHHGQILYITKLVTGQDLGFYKHLEQRK